MSVCVSEYVCESGEKERWFSVKRITVVCGVPDEYVSDVMA